MSVTYSLQLHLVTPNFHGSNRCGVCVSVGNSIKRGLNRKLGRLSQSITTEQTMLSCFSFSFFNFMVYYLTNKLPAQEKKMIGTRELAFVFLSLIADKTE